MRTKLLVIVAIVILSTAAFAGEKTEPAKKSATEWLALVDGGKYAASWDEAASMFKSAVTRATWEGAMHGVREPLGAMKSRTLKSAKYETSLPGAPDGEYVVIQFDTVFANKAQAVETITPMLDKDGKWRVSGYYIK